MNDLHRDLEIMKITTVIQLLPNKHKYQLQNHINTEAVILSNNGIYSRLKQNKPQDLEIAE